MHNLCIYCLLLIADKPLIMPVLSPLDNDDYVITLCVLIEKLQPNKF